MHMADALIAPAVAGTMYACSTVIAGKSIRELKLDLEQKKVPLMGVMGAFVFAAQMINFTIPGTGSSGHICGGILLSALLGPYAGFLSMIGVLLIQCLLFADGGILALGCNIWNMAFYSCFVGAICIWRPIVRRKATKKRIFLASVIANVVTLQLGAFSVTLETLLSGVTELPFRSFVLTMQPIHIAIGVVEGLITASVLCFIFDAKRDLLWGIDETIQEESKYSLKKILIILSFAAVLIGGGLSLVASSNPDGLEWSIEKISGSTEVSNDSNLHSTAQQLQDKTSILPDYTFKNKETKVGTSFSGIVGGSVVVLILVITGLLLKSKRKKVAHE